MRKIKIWLSNFSFWYMTIFHYLLLLGLIFSTPNDHNQTKILINLNMANRYLDNSLKTLRQLNCSLFLRLAPTFITPLCCHTVRNERRLSKFYFLNFLIVDMWFKQKFQANSTNTSKFDLTFTSGINR